MYKKKFKIKLIKDKIISTDDILPAKYKHMFTSSKKLSKYLFKNKYKNFIKKKNKYQVLVSNGIFGIGSSREQAVSALIYKGIKIIISPYFGRIFFRNSWNLGLILIELNIKNIKTNEYIYINFKKKIIKTKKHIYNLNFLNKKTIKFIKNKGIINYLINKKLCHTKKKNKNLMD